MSVVAPPIGAPVPKRASVAELRERFRAGKLALLTHFRESRATAPAASALLRALAKHVDQTLSELWSDAGMPAGAALLAVGGYGRGELFPYSDVDVLVLLPNDHDGTSAGLRGTIEAFITACWDIGLEIGSSVRTVGECIAMAKSDVTVQTALLESRYLCGSRRPAITCRRALISLSTPSLRCNCRVSKGVIRPCAASCCQVRPKPAARATQITVCRSRRPPGLSLQLGSSE
jgi:[protein-PII] uridylyltransferase